MTPTLPDDAYRLLFDGPSAYDQLAIELVNRARLAPTAEAGRQGTSLGSGVSATPSQALAVVAPLDAAAAKHSDAMLDRNFFAHRDPLTGTSPSDRARAEGYGSGAGENIGWIGSTRGNPETAGRVESHHNNLWNSLGHRQNFMNAWYTEVGMGFETGAYNQYGSSSMLTQMFGNRGLNYLTGVVIDDGDGDRFYDIGEGQGGVRITAYNASGAYGTSTWDAGGYSLALEDGTYTVVFEGGDLDGVFETTVTIDGRNVKLDVVEDRDAAAPPPDLSPGLPLGDYSASSAGVNVGIHRIGQGGDAAGHDLSALDRIIGSDQADVLVGAAKDVTLEGRGGEDLLWDYAGNAALYGGANDDVLVGGGGGDLLDGGGGSDWARYTGSAAVTVNLGTGSASGGDATGDRFVSIENLGGSDFADNLTGSNGANEIHAEGGDDLIRGSLGGDSIEGGAGLDTMDYSASGSAVNVGIYRTGTGGTADGDRLSSIERIIGTSLADTLVGGPRDATLEGGAGDDLLWDYAGNGLLIGGGGNDMLNGGIGSDVFRFESTGFDQDIILDFANGTDRIDLGGTGLRFADLTIATSGAHARITHNADQGDAILILNAAGQIDETDFLGLA